jgi:tRNA (guanine-N7-)-methyltransferase
MTVQTRKLSTLTLPWPTDWTAEFGTVGKNRPLIVEIGFGYGQMLFHLAEQFPDANIIGVEVGVRPLEAVERRLIREKVENVRVLYGHAETLLCHMVQPASVSQIHVNFPDPWFKPGHAHKRVMKRLTVDAVASRLVPGGMFYLATDIDAYAEMSHELLAATPALRNQFDTPWAASIANRVTTKYEAKALREGRTNKYFAYQRTGAPGPAVPLIREAPMPNIVFKTATPLAPLADGFTKVSESFHDEDIHISIINVYRSDYALLFEVYVKEPTLDQHVGFLVVPRDDGSGEHTLKLASFGHPRPTLGMHRAAAVIDCVIQRHAEDYTSVHRKIRE